MTLSGVIMSKILSVTGIKVYFKQFLEEPVKAVDGVSFDVFEGENFGIIGETGSGKTTISNLITGLLGAWNKEGNIKFLYKDKLCNIEKIPRPYLCKHLQMAFQDSGMALNPRLKIRENLKEVYKINYKKIDFEENIKKLIGELGLSIEILNKFPSDLSGGMKRRVFLARSFAALGYLPHEKNINALKEPKILILDEITLGLDVPLQNKVMNFIQEVQEHLKVTYLVISHDLNIISMLCKKLIVLHRGRLVEEMNKEYLKNGSLHPYTRLLLNSYHGHPIDTFQRDKTGDILLKGCRSRDICAEQSEECLHKLPELKAISEQAVSKESSHSVACHKYRES